MMRLTVAALCLAGGLAMAQDDDANESEAVVEDLKITLAGMEQIIVTAEKSPLETAGEVDEEIDSILAEAESLEDGS